MLKVALILFCSALFIGEAASVDNFEFLEERDNSIANVATDAETFIQNVKKGFAVNFDEACVKEACNGISISKVQCDSLCSEDEDNFEGVVSQMTKCLLKPICGLDFSHVTIGSFQIPILVPNYPGSCTLKGKNINLSVNPNLNFATSPFENVAYYYTNMSAAVEWKGDLSVACTHDAPEVIPAIKNALGFCPVKIITDLIRSFDFIFGCRVSFDTPKPDTPKPSLAPSFEEPTSIKQTIIMILYFSFFNSESTGKVGGIRKLKIIELQNNIPNAYSLTIEKALENFVQNYQFLFEIYFPVYSAIKEAVMHYALYKCSGCRS